MIVKLDTVTAKERHRTEQGESIERSTGHAVSNSCATKTRIKLAIGAKQWSIGDKSRTHRK